ncbi:MAG: DUF4974 domain-containing protein [Bacteroidetes bacterium]|nr:DUF4974 domain-containing protein [Bacteroidota bacterium]
MDQSKEFITSAVIRSLSGEASEKERAAVRQWIDQNPENQAFYEKLRDERFLTEEFKIFVANETQAKAATWNSIAARIRENNGMSEETAGRQARVIGIKRRYGWMAAAACTLLVITGVYYFKSSRNDSPALQAGKEIAATITGIPPAGMGATLTFSDGSIVSLDTMAVGTLRGQNQATVMKSADGELKYAATGHISKGKVAFNKLTTPRGKQFKLELPDGSKVWLNAGSSIEYPVVFTDSKREVKLEGEAYFEIAHDARHPFFVKIADTTGKKNDDVTIQVLGTSFDAMAYVNESKIQATLLDGSVVLLKGSKKVRLLPGEAASTYRKNDQDLSVAKADIEKVMSWKNGMFIYNQASLPEIMRDIERWYDVEVKYEGDIPDNRFDGYVSRNNSLDKILAILSLNHVHFRVEGRVIIISK